MGSAADSSPNCRIHRGERLPAASGGAEALCAAIEQAVSARAPGVAYSVEIRVLSESRLAATVSVNGRKLPEHNFASVDRPLASGSFERFARALAEQVADGQK